MGDVGSIPLTSLPNQAVTSCPTCGAALSVPHMLLNFLREGTAKDPKLEYEILRLQMQIQGLGVVQVSR